SSTWNFSSRINVSRDFIDSYSPEAPKACWRKTQNARPASAQSQPGGECPPLTLVFGFHARHNALKPLISFRQTGCFFLTLAEEGLQRLVETDGFVDFRAGTGPIGSKADQFLHIGIGRHDLPRPGDDRQEGRVGR